MEKIEKLRAAIEVQGLEAILITSPYNRRYVSNFTGTAGVVLITRNKAFFITDFRYVEQASKQCTGYEIIKQQRTIPRGNSETSTRTGNQKTWI